MRRLALLLKAVNVGGTGKLPMAELKAMLGGMGYEGPETLLASGNAVVGTKDTAAAVERAVVEALAERFGLKTQVLARDAKQLAAVIASNPFADFAAAEPSRMVAMFLDGEPDAGALPALERYCLTGETMAVGPGVLYIRFPDGQADTKLTNGVLERALGLHGTGRNWNTVRKLAEKLG